MQVKELIIEGKNLSVRLKPIGTDKSSICKLTVVSTVLKPSFIEVDLTGEPSEAKRIKVKYT